MPKYTTQYICFHKSKILKKKKSKPRNIKVEYGDKITCTNVELSSTLKPAPFHKLGNHIQSLGKREKLFFQKQARILTRSTFTKLNFFYNIGKLQKCIL